MPKKYVVVIVLDIILNIILSKGEDEVLGYPVEVGRLGRMGLSAR